MMTQITTLSNLSAQVALSPPVEKALQMLKPAERSLMAAAHAPSVVKLPMKSTLQAMIQVVQMAYTIAGQKSEPADWMTMAKLSYRRILEKFPNATLPEIAKAVENGVYGQYGEYFGINAKSLVWFVEEYMKSPTRTLAREEFRKLEKQVELPAAPVVTDYSTQEYWTQQNITHWTEQAELYYGFYLSGNAMFRTLPEAVFWLLVGTGKLQITPDEQKRIYQEAKQNYKLELLSRTDPDKEWKLNAIKTESNTGINIHIQLEAARFAVFEYFAVIREQNHQSIPWKQNQPHDTNK